MRNLLVFFSVLLICSCVSSGSVNTGASSFSTAWSGSDSHYVTVPGSGNLQVLGVSGRLSSREAEIEMAREDAARRVSMYHGIFASVVAIQEIGHGFLDYLVDSATVIEYDQDLEKYFDRLTFDPERDVTRNNDGSVFIRFTYPVTFPGNISYSFGRGSGGGPGWVSQQPHEIGGFLAGVGTHGRQERLRDTVRRSNEAAVSAIITQASSFVESTDTMVGGQSQSLLRRESSGHLSNFTVLEVWIDPRSGAVWTLAIARHSE